MAPIEFKCTVTSTGLKCFFPYNPTLVARIKKIPKIHFNAKDKSWSIPFAKTPLSLFKEFLTEMQLTVKEDVTAILDRAETYTDDLNKVSFLGENKLCFVFEYDQTKVDRLKQLGAKYSANIKGWVLIVNKTNARGVNDFLAGFSVQKEALDLILFFSQK